ncbi:hypothetical protein LPU83_pLPU83d_0214 (plasmid) [Rhizobium favelukesii]|uniref:Uncharacterized protein n=1 Tax=Rhizobium favelukesii TaxID=348824 RepID=W6RMZ0_9HYPH|nr:hypothetical protein LPU83_pLPU83d_0214 [Rhizobium favelukesii]
MRDFNKSQCGNLKGARGAIADAVATRECCTLNEEGNLYIVWMSGRGTDCDILASSTEHGT